MLESLVIRNYALIEDLTIDFRPGFNVLSGETGAGKSIIIGALGAILGGKAASESVRTGAQLASLEALFDCARHPLALEFLRANGFDQGGGEVVVRRTIAADGKSRCFVNGSLANQAILKDLGSLLVDIHGQHEHQSLLNVRRHIELLDAFGGLDGEAKAIGALSRELARLVEQSGALEMDEREKQRRLELNEFAIREIESAAPRVDEEEALAEEARVLNNFEKVYAALEEAYGALHESGGALAQAQQAARALDGVAEMDGRIAAIASKTHDAVFSLEDVADELRAFRGHIEFSPARQEEVNARLATLQQLKRKYGETLAEVLAYRDKCAQENESISMSETRKAELAGEIEALKDRAREAAFGLSARRQAAARELEKRVMQELAFLGMEKTVFVVDIKYVRDPEGFLQVDDDVIRLFADGVDYVEFLIAPNPGEAPRPLRKIASGGEISRVMLSLKTVLTAGNECDTVVFDEVDAGIGGVTASAVGKKLREVARGVQVLCITHLPQIAALADHHLQVAKGVAGGRTRTEVRHLADDERMEELARMLGGEHVSATTLAQAREMVEKGRAN